MTIQLALFCLYIFVITSAISYLSIPQLKKLASRYNILDLPDPRKIHKHPTPLLGGIAIWGSFTSVILLHLIIVIGLKTIIKEAHLLSPDMVFYADNILPIIKEIVVFLVCGALIMIIGLIDDIKKVPIWQRLAFETIVAFIIVYMGFRPELYFLPRSLVWIVTIIWIVGIINAFNLLDGADGLASGVGMIAASLLSVVMFLGNQPLLGILLIASVASILGFFRYNFPRASIFMGSAGSMFIGYILSIITVLATFMISEVSSYFAILIPIAILGIPIYDTSSVVIIRIFEKKSLVSADKNHLIHRLMHKGIRGEKAVLYIYIFAFCSGLSAIFLLNASTIKSALIFGVIMAVYISLFLFERYINRE